MDENRSKTRGPYRYRKRAPRQTLHNRRKRQSKQATSSTVVDPEVPLETLTQLHEDSTFNTSSESNEDATVPGLTDNMEDGLPPALNPPVMVHASPRMFEGSMLTQDTSQLLIKSFMCRHHLTFQGQEDLLHLMQLHLPHNNLLPRSLFKFEKSLNLGSSSVSLAPDLHYYCAWCYTLLSDTEVSLCPNEYCSKVQSPESSQHFITVPIAEQLKILLARHGFFESLQKHPSRKPDGNMVDIHDGEVYQALASGDGPLVDKRNISVVLNTDGVSVFHSTNYQIWPVLLMINELPFAERKQPKNMILAGLWYSTEKPRMQVLQPVIEMLCDLESTGVEVHPPNVEPFVMKVCVVCCTCDLPARASVQNFMQFNGLYGCCYCEQPGKTATTEKKWSCACISYILESPKGPPRTQEACIQYAREAIATRSVITGVKGPSFLSCLKHFNFIKGMLPDYMHGSLLGVSKLLLKLWTDSAKCSGTQHDIRADIPLIDERIKGIHVPTEMHRKPHGLSDLKHWKGLWLLLQSSPSQDDISTAEILFQHFCLKFEAYYGQRHYTFNVHQLLHMADAVRDLGPLWAHSAFPFEDTNGWLGDLFHGARNPHKQIVNAFIERQRLAVVASSVIDSDNETKETREFLSQMLRIGQRYSVTANLGQGHLVLGKTYNAHELTQAEQALIYDNFPSANVLKGIVYNRVAISGIVYSNSSYRHSNSVSSDHILCFMVKGEKSIGTAEKFFSFCYNECDACAQFCNHVVVVNHHNLIPCAISIDTITSACAKQIHVISPPCGIRVYCTSSIRTKCVSLQLSDAGETVIYIAELPNFEEKNL